MSDLPNPRQPGSTGAAGPGIEAWARDYAADLRRFLAKRRLIDSDIHDICQEVYLRLLRFERAEVIKNPMAYLLRVAANVAHDFKLRHTGSAPLDAEQLEVPASDPTPEDSADIAYRRRRLMDAVSRLPPLPRAALMLQAQEDASYDAIAARLGISHRAVKRAVLRGHALLREALQEELRP